MSEAGKVSLPMTHERITKVRKLLSGMNQSGQLFPITVGDLNSLLAALEEAEQEASKQNAEAKRLNEICNQIAGEEMLFQDGKYETEMQKLEGRLAEAQQTIETLRIAKDYEIELHAKSCIEYQETIALKDESLLNYEHYRKIYQQELRDAEQTIARLTAALIVERDDALTWDGIGTVNRINKALGETQP